MFFEVVFISNLGVVKTGFTVEDSGSFFLEYVNGFVCIISDGRRINYIIRIYFVCFRGSLVRRWGGGVEELVCFLFCFRLVCERTWGGREGVW